MGTIKRAECPRELIEKLGHAENRRFFSVIIAVCLYVLCVVSLGTGSLFLNLTLDLLALLSAAYCWLCNKRYEKVKAQIDPQLHFKLDL